MINMYTFIYLKYGPHLEFVPSGIGGRGIPRVNPWHGICYSETWAISIGMVCGAAY